MEASDFSTVAIDDYETVDGLHSVPVLSMEATQTDEPRFLFNESDTLRTSSLQERFVQTDDVWWWERRAPFVKKVWKHGWKRLQAALVGENSQLFRQMLALRKPWTLPQCRADT